MALTITNNWTNVDLADALSGWSVFGGASGAALNTEQQRTGSGCISCRMSGRGGLQYDNGSGIDMSGQGAVQIWVQSIVPITDVATTGGMTLRLESTAGNWEEWQVKLGVEYFNEWTRITVDIIGTTPDSTLGTFDDTSVQFFTIQADPSVTLMGNVKTFYVDRIDVRDTNDKIHAITVTGSVAVAGALFAEIRDDATNDAIGAVLAGTGNIQLNAPIELADDGTGSDTLTSRDEDVAFQNQVVADGFYEILFNANSTGTNTHEWGVKIGSGAASIGSQGTRIKSAGPTWNFLAANVDIDNFKMYGCVFSDCETIELGDGTTSLGGAGDTFEMVDVSFVNSGRLLRDIAAATILEVGNIISFSSDVDACIDLIDERDISVINWGIIQAAGFIHSPAGSPTILTIDYDFNLFSKPYIQVNTNETWDLVNPTVTINTGTQDELDFLVDSGNSVEKLFDINILARRVITAIEDVFVWLGYTTTDGTATTDSASNTLPSTNRVTSDVSGEATSRFTQDIYTELAATTLDDTPKTDAFLIAYHYGDQPMFRSLATVSALVDLALSVLIDNNIDETVQATALTNGGAIAIVKDSSTPFAIIFFTGGDADPLVAGDVITGGSSGFTGTVIELVSGVTNGTGAVLVENVTGTFTNGEALDSDGAPVWSAVSDQTANPQQEFDWGINNDTKTLQEGYDFHMASLAQVHATTVTDGYDEVIRWCEDENTSLIQAIGGDSYSTERNARLGEGVVIYNYGVGRIAHFTDNAGNTFTPPVTAPLTITVLDDSTGLAIANTARVVIYIDSSKVEILNSAVNGSGVASGTVSYTGDIAIGGWAREMSLTGTDYEPKDFSGTLTINGFSLTVRLTPLPN